LKSGITNGSDHCRGRLLNLWG